MPVAVAQSLSIVLFLVPLVLTFALRARAERSLEAVAMDIPLVVAVDILTILVATRFVTLEVATLVSRPLWILGAIGTWLRLRRRGQGPRWPRALGLRACSGVLIAILTVSYFCSFISMRYVVWDEQWHTSLVSALTVEKIPFVNALSEHDVLHYHFAGDVAASMQRTLSFDVISANRALHSAHDVLFALAAAFIALLLLARPKVGALFAALGAAAVLFHGPIPLRGNVGLAGHGYSYYSFIMLSYRPHVSLAGLLSAGIVASVFVRGRGPSSLRDRETIPVLLSSTALLSITDETSTALLGLALGITWLAFPEILAGSRRRGLVVLILLATAVIGSNLLFAASLAPGGPIQKIAFAKTWRVPPISSSYPALQLSTADGRRVFFLEMIPMLLAGLALARHALRNRKRRRATAALLLFAGTVVTAGSALALRIDINGDATEAHRFFVAPLLSSAVLVVLVLPEMLEGTSEVALAVLAAGAPLVCSVYWIREIAPQYMAPQKASAERSTNVFATNCRDAADAHFFDHPRAVYVAASIFERYVGCRPVFSPARTDASWTTKINPLTNAKPQLTAMESSATDPAEEFTAICPPKNVSADAVCAVAARVRTSCRDEGTDFVACPLTRAQRDEILRGE